MELEALEPGTARVFRFAGEPALLVRRGDGTYLALGQKCTHLACPVTYRPAAEGEAERLECHCHRGRFDLETLQGTGGPPRALRPLRRIALQVEPGRVRATGFAEHRG